MNQPSDRNSRPYNTYPDQQDADQQGMDNAQGQPQGYGGQSYEGYANPQDPNAPYTPGYEQPNGAAPGDYNQQAGYTTPPTAQNPAEQNPYGQAYQDGPAGQNYTPQNYASENYAPENYAAENYAQENYGQPGQEQYDPAQNQGYQDPAYQDPAYGGAQQDGGTYHSAYTGANNGGYEAIATQPVTTQTSAQGYQDSFDSSYNDPSYGGDNSYGAPAGYNVNEGVGHYDPQAPSDLDQGYNSFEQNQTGQQALVPQTSQVPQGSAFQENQAYAPNQVSQTNQPVHADADFYDAENTDDEFEPAPKGRKPVIVVGALVSAIAVGAAMAYTYKNGGLSSNVTANSGAKPEIIQADNTPVKIKPANEGGKEFPNRNKLIYDRLDGQPSSSPQNERIVPRQEQVFDTSQIASSISGNKNSENAGKPQQGERISALRGPVNNQPGPQRSNTSPNNNGPRKVKIISIRPDGSVVNPAPKAQNTGQGPTRSAAKPQEPEQFPGLAVTVDTPGPSQPSPQRTAPKQPAVSATQPVRRSAAPAQNAPTRTATRTTPAPAAPRAAASGQFVVQVAARRSQTDALAAFADLQQKYPSLLVNYRPIIKKADLGSKGVWYRLQVGPLGQRASASKLCQNLKSAGMRSCLVRPL